MLDHVGTCGYIRLLSHREIADLVDLSKNLPAKFLLRDPWGKPLLQGTKWWILHLRYGGNRAHAGANPPGFAPAWARFPPYLKCRIHHNFSREASLRGSIYLSMCWERSIRIVYTRLVERLRSQTVWDEGLLPRGFDSLHISGAKFIIISAERRVCVGAFTCSCSPGVEAWHGDPYSGIRPTPGQGPAWTGSRFKDSGPAWRDRRCDHAVTPQKEMLPRVHRLADSRPLEDWICDEFCI